MMRETLAQVHGGCRAEHGAPRTSPKGDVEHLALLHLGIKVAKESTVEHSVEQSFTYSFFTLLWKGQSKVSPKNVHSSLMAASPSLPSPAADAGPWPTPTSLCCSRTPTPPHGV